MMIVLDSGESGGVYIFYTQEKFAFKCTVAAQSRSKALKAANDDHFNDNIHVAAA